ncbi:hypothetical protein A8A01_15150 [Ewingella americana]|nr:hypothetical protein A8A01_15150 [Ewingella americana]
MEIRYATKSDLDKVCEILATEFYNDPVLKHAFKCSAREQRMSALRHFFRIYAEQACARGGVLLAEDYAGVLIYFRPDFMETTYEVDGMQESQLKEKYGQDYATIAALMDGLNDAHPETPKHFYVFAVAIQSRYRGSKVVNSLFKKLNTILDNSKSPCYAECTSFTMRTLMKRFGYSDAGPPLCISGFPDLFPIWRETQ